MRTVNITDFSMKSKTLAKVVISFTGDIDPNFIHTELAKKLEYKGTPIRSSFKQVKPGVAVGFIRANKQVRSVSADEIQAGYRVMSSNIMMDNSDKSLWEVKDNGAAGKYLARHGEEDLTALVASTAQRRPDSPRLGQITIARAAASEMVAFVDDDGDVDHGFAVATNDDKVKVLSFSRRIPVTVDYDSVVSIYPVSVPRELHNRVTASLTAEQKKNAKDYYTRLYSYDENYLRLILEEIDTGTVA